jgi:hypothetical protein
MDVGIEGLMIPMVRLARRGPPHPRFDEIPPGRPARRGPANRP